MLCALAFVPINDVVDVFDCLAEEVPEKFLPFAEYFKQNYVRGITARGRRRAVAPPYPPKLWNQYDAVLNRFQRTNNLSEGWHNRFQKVVGRNHPGLYAFFAELQKEQNATETMCR